MTIDAITFAALCELAGRKFGTFDVACPACGPERRARANRNRRVLRLWYNNSDVITYACARCGAAGFARAGGHVAATESKPATLTANTDTDAERTAKALRIWRQAVSPVETVVERYLRERGLELPPEAAGEEIRYHPRCPFGRGVVTRAMVALVRDVRTDKPLGIHRTALTDDGYKASIGGQSRMSLGPIGGGAVKLTPDAEVSLGLGVGEGIESTLSLRLLDGCSELAVWALLSANEVQRFPVMAAVEGVWVAVDHDIVGLAAADALRERWQAAGRDVVTVRPRADGADLNDLARAAHG